MFSTPAGTTCFGVTRALSLPGFCVHRCRVCLRYVAVAPRLRGTLRGEVKTEIVRPDQEPGCAEHLARFFPQAAAVRIPVQVTALRGGRTKLREAATVEFAAADFAIFLSTLPLEFDDRVRLERDRKGRTAEATVIAVQYYEGRKAVAVKFAQGPCDWVTQP